MAEVTKMVDMALSPQEAMESTMPMSMANAPRYPYGLCLSLCQDELEKLGLDAGDMEVGDVIHLHALAKVTSCSENETESGSNCRVELQIVMMDIESEDEENEEADQVMSAKKRRSTLYKD